MTSHYSHIGMEAKIQAVNTLPCIDRNKDDREIDFTVAVQKATTEGLLKLVKYLDGNLSRKQKKEVIGLLVS